jgi:hypothetical protein
MGPEQPHTIELAEGYAVRPEEVPERPTTIERYQRALAVANEHLDAGNLQGALYASGDALLMLKSGASPDDEIARAHIESGSAFHQELSARIESARVA